MGRLVVVSNRIADPRKTAAGGLAVALGEVLNNSGGLWFGWSGKLVEEPAGTDLPVQVHQAGPVRLATMDLTREDYDAYYLGYSNGVLWPVLHYRLDLADFDTGYIEGYRRGDQPFPPPPLPPPRPPPAGWGGRPHPTPPPPRPPARG